MAFNELKQIQEITILPEEGTVQVRWKTSVDKDGEVIASKDHYEVYSESQKVKMETDLGTYYTNYSSAFDKLWVEYAKQPKKAPK